MHENALLLLKKCKNLQCGDPLASGGWRLFPRPLIASGVPPQPPRPPWKILALPLPVSQIHAILKASVVSLSLLAVTQA